MLVEPTRTYANQIQLLTGEHLAIAGVCPLSSGPCVDSLAPSIVRVGNRHNFNIGNFGKGDVDAVAHGEEAVRSASTYAFDVIVLDIEMPVMDGITAARSIRRLGGKASATPIMALSAFLADAMQSASWSDTFDIALPKPANKNELHAALQLSLIHI